MIEANLDPSLGELFDVTGLPTFIREKNLTFHQAMDALTRGDMVARVGWDDFGWYLVYDDTVELVDAYGAWEPTFECDDVFARDWYIVHPEAV